jgi:hypothetical protein
MGANAQTAVPAFTAGPSAAQLQQQTQINTGIPVFATTTTRDAAFGGTGEKTLAEGQFAYIEAIGHDAVLRRSRVADRWWLGLHGLLSQTSR